MQHHNLLNSNAEEQGRTALLNHFALENVQYLSIADLQNAQFLAGHGKTWGTWETPKDLAPGKIGVSLRAFHIRKRIKAYLQSETECPEEFVDEGVVAVTRLGLLLRISPSGGRGGGRNQRLKPHTVAKLLYVEICQMVARAIERRTELPNSIGLFSCLTLEDVHEFAASVGTRIELNRIATLISRGWWSDAPPHYNIASQTDPRGPKAITHPQSIDGEFQAISDNFLVQAGPRVMWLIQDLGPNILLLSENFATYLEQLDWAHLTFSKLIGRYGLTTKFFASHAEKYPWIDRFGSPLEHTYSLEDPSGNEIWPPTNFKQLKTLSAALQGAHLFISLLSCAARVGEVESLSRSCVTTKRDRNNYVHGWTYKLSSNLFGDRRQWPAPDVLVMALGQQSRLANVSDRLPAGRLEDGLPTTKPTHGALWLSLGTGGQASPGTPLVKTGHALKMLAVRLGLDPKPDGINLHPHRFRKTVARVAGVALFNSPLVLKRLFGHKSIEMTLHYILSDPDLRTQAEIVLRELRVMHCAETLDEIRDSISNGIAPPAHSGAQTTVLANTIREHESRLNKVGRVWTNHTAYDLAQMLTANGQGWRFIQKDVVCSKLPGEAGLCRAKKSRGEPDTSNCKSECSNRIVLARRRRDVKEVANSYLDIACQAFEDEQFLVFHDAMTRFVDEVNSFPDIKIEFLAKPDVQTLLAAFTQSAS